MAPGVMTCVMIAPAQEGGSYVVPRFMTCVVIGPAYGGRVGFRLCVCVVGMYVHMYL
jgi:hypothetical protein